MFVTLIPTSIEQKRSSLESPQMLTTNSEQQADIFTSAQITCSGYEKPFF